MLTKAQFSALSKIAESPNKSGRFWRDLGISPATIARLEEGGLVNAKWRPFTMETTITRRSWHVTEAGRTALHETTSLARTEGEKR